MITGSLLMSIAGAIALTTVAGVSVPQTAIAAECDNDGAGANNADDNNDATNLACGSNAEAGSTPGVSDGDSFNTALGTDANATSGPGSVGSNTAVGWDANATGGAAVAVGEDADATGLGSIAIGSDPELNGEGPLAEGAHSVVIGSEAVATAASTGGIAIGGDVNADSVGATVSAANAIAIGADVHTSGTNAIGIGTGASASGAGSVAIGTNSDGVGAVASRDNQIVLGTASHSYTTPGITGEGSRSFQSGPLDVVTTDAQGNLASDGGQIFRELGEQGAGIAIATALENPDLVNGETFGLAANIGFFEGNSALAIAAMGVIGQNFMGGNERWAVSGGVGVSLNENNYGGQSTDRAVAGRAGVQVSW